VCRSALENLRCGIGYINQSLLWAVPYERPEGLDFNGFRDCQGIFEFNAKISHCTVHLGVTQQKLNSTQNGIVKLTGSILNRTKPYDKSQTIRGL
jgi:hypothetical protein